MNSKYNTGTVFELIPTSESIYRIKCHSETKFTDNHAAEHDWALFTVAGLHINIKLLPVLQQVSYKPKNLHHLLLIIK